jgi:NAD(P)-dependent dehydrogenase (short-subunit alcohol dehydrogenase family)
VTVSDRRVALVTGGTRGIGLGIARALAREGCDLALCGRRPKAEVAGILRELEDAGAQVLYRPADIGRREDRQRLLGAVRERFGRLHVLVNNAGMAPRVRADILEASEESFEEVMRTNLQGPYFLTQAVARWMIEQKRADEGFYCIVNISSISATVASVSRGEYCLSKAALSMATALWATRLAEFDIPVYEVRPGIIDTDMTAPVKEKYDRLIAGGLVPQARWGRPADVGRAVAMLARGDLPYSTGQVILVDGGLTLPRL